MATQVTQVEFVGGPLDGIVEAVLPASLPAIVSWPVNPQDLEASSGLIVPYFLRDHDDLARRRSHATKVAYYELQHRSGTFRYSFWGIRRVPPKSPGGSTLEPLAPLRAE